MAHCFQYLILNFSRGVLIRFLSPPCDDTRIVFSSELHSLPEVRIRFIIMTSNPKTLTSLESHIGEDFQKAMVICTFILFKLFCKTLIHINYCRIIFSIDSL